MEWLWDIAIFAAKSLWLLVVIVAGVGLITAIIGSAVRRARPRGMGRVQVTSVTDHYRAVEESIEAFTLDKKTRKKRRNERKKRDAKQSDLGKVWVIEFQGDLAATQVSELREQVTAVLAVADPDKDEVVALVESAGGIMQNYGLAASQLVRIRDAGIKLTVCIDKVAASGGYLMAAVADHIKAAPFAVVGSIGVLAMVPNFHRLLKKYDIDYLELTAGKYKRTLSYLGEITDEGMDHFRQELQDSHELFKRFIGRYRESLDLDKVATGEHWFGEDAIALSLIDAINTSDDYLLSRSKDAEIYRIDFEVAKSVKEKFAGVLSDAGDNVLMRWWDRLGGRSRFRAQD